MHLVEGSTIVINLKCGCSEKRVTVIEGNQMIVCSRCSTKTYVSFEKDNRDDSFKLYIQ